MRLSIMLQKTKLPRGHIFRGKYRLVKEVTPLAAANLRNDYIREEKNIMLLSKPYLTLEQSCGHSKALGLHEKRTQEVIDKRTVWKRQNVTIEERLRHLRVLDAWD